MTSKRKLRRRIEELGADQLGLRLPELTYTSATVLLGPQGEGQPTAITFPVLTIASQRSGLNVLDLPSLGYRVTKVEQPAAALGYSLTEPTPADPEPIG